MADLPLLKTALICETVIQGADGILSLINIIDRRMITAQGQDVPPEMPPHEWEFNLVLMFVSGIYVGKAKIAVAVQSPDGLRKPIHASETYFEGGDRGANLIVRMKFTFKTEGQYWFEVYVNDQPVTRVPARVIYNPVTQQLLPPP
jgi:hypothetical protein